ncbi:MAG: hypothetical protein R3B84_06360 [Zavarzinella sp.]
MMTQPENENSLINVPLDEFFDQIFVDLESHLTKLDHQLSAVPEAELPEGTEIESVLELISHQYERWRVGFSNTADVIRTTQAQLAEQEESLAQIVKKLSFSHQLIQSSDLSPQNH